MDENRPKQAPEMFKNEIKKWTGPENAFPTSPEARGRSTGGGLAALIQPSQRERTKRAMKAPNWHVKFSHFT